MNLSDEERDGAGLSCLWPITTNKLYRKALDTAASGGSPNNISPAIRYGVGDFSFLWMGDMETDMQKEFDSNVNNVILPLFLHRTMVERVVTSPSR